MEYPFTAKIKDGNIQGYSPKSDTEWGYTFRHTNSNIITVTKMVLGKYYVTSPKWDGEKDWRISVNDVTVVTEPDPTPPDDPNKPTRTTIEVNGVIWEATEFTKIS